MLGDEGWGAIFAAICGNKDSKIMSMDASDENIGPAGVKLIAEALRTSVTGAVDAKSGGELLDARHVRAVVGEVISGQVDARQPACDSDHSRHRVCSKWTNAVVPEVERRDGLADCANALIFEEVIGQQGRQADHDRHEVRKKHAALNADVSLLLE